MMRTSHRTLPVGTKDLIAWRGHVSEASALRWTGYSGVAAVALYVGATVVGGMLDPAYSHIRQHISDLTATGASGWAALAPLYMLYNVLLIGFAACLYLASTRGWPWRIGAGLLVLNAIAGVMMVTLFREDPGGVANTTAGAGHIVFAGISSLTTVVGSFVYGVAFRRSETWRSLAWFSFAIGIGVAVLGPLAAIATAQQSDLAGLAERGPIGLFMVWLVVVGGFSLISARRSKARGATHGE